MELRHLRYFIAVAEEGSLTNAAERRLHTAQPSLSRQIRDLELEIGVRLIDRKARGIALTAAGRVFLDHARLALMQIDVACEAARGTEKPEKAVAANTNVLAISFALSFRWHTRHGSSTLDRRWEASSAFLAAKTFLPTITCPH